MTDILPVSREEIRDFSKYAPKPEGEIRSFVGENFFEEVQKLVDPANNYSGLYTRLYSLALDPGLKKEHKFQDKIAKPVAMLNRQAFLYELRKKAGVSEKLERENRLTYSREKPFTILSLDIAGLREADIAGSADYNLNIFASELNKVFQQIKEQYIKGNERDFLVGRYGGDEFFVGLIGDFTGEEVEEIKSKIKNHLEKVRIIIGEKEKNLRLKNDQVEEIKVPEDKDESLIFLSFLRRGLVLNNEQVKKEKEYFSDQDGQVNKERLNEYLRRALFEPEEKDIDLDVKISNLINKHPELKVPFYFVQYQDRQNNDTENTKQRQVLEFVENYMADPLLDEIVLSRFDLIDHIKRGEFKSICAFELKLKEINDNLSFVYGDEVITSLWKDKLKSSIEPFIKKGLVSLGRIGGMVFLGIKSKINDLERQQLNNVLSELEKVQSVEVNYRGKKVSHTVGFAQIDVSLFLQEEKGRRPEDIIGEMSKKTTDDWIEKSFRKIFENEEYLSLFAEMVQDIQGKYTEENSNLDIFLFARYFNGKRFSDRIDLAKKILEEKLAGEFEEEVKRIIEVFDSIFSSLKEKYKINSQG